jgi:hypothetical protein
LDELDQEVEVPVVARIAVDRQRHEGLTHLEKPLGSPRFRASSSAGVAVDVTSEIVIDRPCDEVAAFAGDPSLSPAARLRPLSGARSSVAG